MNSWHDQIIAAGDRSAREESMGVTTTVSICGNAAMGNNVKALAVS